MTRTKKNDISHPKNPMDNCKATKTDSNSQRTLTFKKKKNKNRKKNLNGRKNSANFSLE
jgi:hypothetical protein